MKSFRLLFFILFLLAFNRSFSQRDAVGDSLNKAFFLAKHDTSRAFALLAYGEFLYVSDPDTARVIWEKAKHICEDNLKKDLNSVTRRAFRNHLATVFVNLGIVLQDAGKLSEALNLSFEALKIKEEVGDKEDAANVNVTIAGIYSQLDNNEKALQYYLKGLKGFEETKSKDGIAYTNHNIGTLYNDIGHPEKAEPYYKKAIEISDEIGDYAGLAYGLGSMGTLYHAKKDYKTALDYYLKSIKLHEEIGNKHGLTPILSHTGKLYSDLNKPTEAERYYKRALDLSNELGYPENISLAARGLWMLYKKQQKGMPALEMYELHIRMRDSANSQEARKAGIQKEIQYNYDKKAAADSVMNAEKIVQQKIQHDEAIKQQRIYTYSGIVGFVLMLVIAGISFRAFKNKQKANEVISQQKKLVEGQKHLIEEKQKEIIDSIMYARRIQRSLLSHEKYIDRSLKRLNKN